MDNAVDSLAADSPESPPGTVLVTVYLVAVAAVFAATPTNNELFIDPRVSVLFVPFTAGWESDTTFTRIVLVSKPANGAVAVISAVPLRTDMEIV